MNNNKMFQDYDFFAIRCDFDGSKLTSENFRKLDEDFKHLNAFQLECVIYPTALGPQTTSNTDVKKCKKNFLKAFDKMNQDEIGDGE